MSSKKLLLIAFIAASFIHPASSQIGDARARLDKMIQIGMEQWHIPGMAAVVVKDGEVAFQKTYGIRSVASDEPVDENTLFNMGSTTKAIIAMSVGILVDQGKLNWDDKVREHLPTFELSESYVSADARVKDLLTHNLGIANADLLWFLDSLSTEETISRFSLAKKSYPLRGGFTYQNIMYVIAGEVIEAVSGQHWTEFVEEHILTPLEMDRTQTKSVKIVEAGNYVSPHYYDSAAGLERVGQTFADQIGAAGMLWSSASDIGNYLTFLVNGGSFKGKVILQPETFAYLFKPQTVLPEPMYPTNKLVGQHWDTYGLGWFQQDYRGNKLDYHTGSLLGLCAIAGVMHDQKTAVYVFANLDHAELRHAILYKAIDLFAFEDDERDWNKEIFELYSDLKIKERESQEKLTKERHLDTKTSHPLTDYAGTYTNEMLGTVRISVVDSQLLLNFNDHKVFNSEYWHYDTFRTKEDPILRIKMLFQFTASESGSIDELEIFGEKFVRIINTH